MQRCSFIYCIILNLTGLFSMWMDKRKAQKRKWRISERTLFSIALLGGSFGSLLGMYLYHHKTKHLHFVIGIPAILLVQIAAIVFLHFYLPNSLF